VIDDDYDTHFIWTSFSSPSMTTTARMLSPMTRSTRNAPSCPYRHFYLSRTPGLVWFLVLDPSTPIAMVGLAIRILIFFLFFFFPLS